jgi:hypothetical protein
MNFEKRPKVYSPTKFNRIGRYFIIAEANKDPIAP